MHDTFEILTDLGHSTHHLVMNVSDVTFCHLSLLNFLSVWYALLCLFCLSFVKLLFVLQLSLKSNGRRSISVTMSLSSKYSSRMLNTESACNPFTGLFNFCVVSLLIKLKTHTLMRRVHDICQENSGVFNSQYSIKVYTGFWKYTLFIIYTKFKLQVTVNLLHSHHINSSQ